MAVNSGMLLQVAGNGRRSLYHRIGKETRDGQKREAER